MEAEQIGEILDELGRRIGPYGEHVWEITVRQVWIDGLVWGLFMSVALVLSLVGIWLVWRHYGRAMAAYRDSERNYGAYRPDKDGYWFGTALMTLVALVASLTATAYLTNLLNPEYHALMRLLEKIVP